MTITMYQASVPVFIRMLNNLVTILEKAAAHAEAKKIDPAVLIDSRLYPDMFPLARQIRIATDAAAGGAARLAGIEPPKSENNETTFPDLIGRIRKTITYVNTFKPEQIDGSEKRQITLKVRDDTLTLDGQTFLLNRVLPNFYFHITTAYGILRHNGIELGKKDYLGKF
ncbi:MAG: DUF1993 domain-containing protein [Sulfuricaulis sp.]